MRVLEGLPISPNKPLSFPLFKARDRFLSKNAII